MKEIEEIIRSNKNKDKKYERQWQRKGNKEIRKIL